MKLPKCDISPNQTYDRYGYIRTVETVNTYDPADEAQYQLVDSWLRTRNAGDDLDGLWPLIEIVDAPALCLRYSANLADCVCEPGTRMAGTYTQKALEQVSADGAEHSIAEGIIRTAFGVADGPTRAGAASLTDDDPAALAGAALAVVAVANTVAQAPGWDLETVLGAAQFRRTGRKL